ncbi:hypothetical protein ACXR6G_14980 [Ancylomarina sp. YFZ004]
MKSIYFLRYLFSFAYFMLIVIAVGMGVAYLLNIFFGIGNFHPSWFFGVGEATTNLTYSIGGDAVEIANASVDVGIRNLSSESIYMKIFGFVNFSILVMLAIFNFKYLSSLFYNFSEVDSWGGYFTRENYFFIRRIAYLTLGVTLYTFLTDSLFSWVLIKDLTAFGEPFQVNPSVSGFSSLVTVLVLFGAARIFKAAIEMKEEAEHTI